MLLATVPGWERGFGVGGNTGAWEDVHHRQGTFGAAPSATQYEHIETYGASMEDGSPTSPTFCQYQGGAAPTLSYQFIAGLSVFMCVRPEAAGLDATAVFKDRGTPLGVANNGWDITLNTANNWRVQICDGTTQIQCVGTSTPSFNVAARINSVVGFTWDLANIRLYVDGKLETTTACALNPALVFTTQSPRWFGSGVTAADVADITVGMGGIWGRVLSPSEIGLLYVDPFRVWRPFVTDKGLSAYQTFFLAF